MAYRTFEPCLCGADDCPRCRPNTWRESRDDDAVSERLAVDFATEAANDTGDFDDLVTECLSRGEFPRKVSTLLALLTAKADAKKIEEAIAFLKEDLRSEYDSQNRNRVIKELRDEAAAEEAEAQIDAWRERKAA